MVPGSVSNTPPHHYKHFSMAKPKGVPKKVKKGTPPPVDRLLIPAIGVALALVAFQFIRGLTGGIARVSLADEAALRQVVYGEAPDTAYAVLCQSEESTAPISSVFNDAFNEAASPAVFRVVDCEATLPTEGKSIAEHFKIDLKQRPTIFLAGGSVGKPTQIPSKHLKTGSMLTKYLKAKLEKRAAKIETTQDLRNKCLNKPTCGLLLKGGKKAPSHLKDAVSKLLQEYPDVTFAAVDASVLYVLNLEEHIPEFENGQARFVVFSKVSGGTGTDDSRLITSMAAASHASYGPMSSLVASVLQKTATLQKLPSLPQVKTRTKKLEEAERAKRQRKLEQQRRQFEGDATSGSGSTSSASDDMKEERRRERERRRAEHYAANNVKPKTPEEIADMERRRRARMEEEAAKWNMPDGDYVPDEEGFDMFEDDELYSEGAVVVEDASEEDEEDVIDLD